MYHNIPLFEDCISLFYLSGCCHAWMEEKKKAIPSQISTCGTLRGKVNVINATRDQLHNKETFLLNLFCLVNLSGSIHFFGPVRGVVDNGMR